VWLGACRTGWTGESGNLTRRCVSHFGYAQTVPGEFRFNVVHLDGHVSQHIWKEAYISDSYTVPDPDNDWWRPIGWPWEGGSTANGIVEETTNDWAFDK
jgi:prepilin-type processing-associated H-X9-DG protein